MCEAVDVERLVQRVTALEKRNGLLKVGGVVAAVALGVGILVVGRAEKIVAAQKFVVVDSAGRETGWLDGAGGFPRLAFVDGKERTRMVMDVGSDGSARVLVRDGDEKTRILMGTKPDGTPMLFLLDAEGKVVWSALQPELALGAYEFGGENWKPGITWSPPSD